MIPKYIAEFVPGTEVVLDIVVETDVVWMTVDGSVEITDFEKMNRLKCKNSKATPRICRKSAIKDFIRLHYLSCVV